MERFPLPMWLKKGPQITKLAQAFGDYWDKAEGWVQTPLQQHDAETCHVSILKMMAYQRDVERFANEPDELFRKRVKYAARNALDAGSVAGFVAIFQRLGIGYVELVERSDPVDWDVISLRLSDSQIASNTELLGYIIQQYGRTCRRYTLEVITPVEIGVSVAEVGHSWSLDVAKEVIEPWQAQTTITSADVGHSWALDVATV